jgi:hypothetical protein
MNVTLFNGEPVSTPGVIRGLPIDLYHGDCCAGPSISSSGLRTVFQASPAHYFADSYLNPEREPPEPKEAFIFGRAAHHLLLGEAEFNRHFVIRPEKIGDQKWNANATVCKEWLNHCLDQGLTVLTPAQIEAIRGMSRGLAEHPMVRAGILNGLIEHSIIWQDKETGVWLKVRPDAIPTSDLDFSDLKSCADISDDGLEKAIGERGYHVQGALVGMACREVLERPMNSFSLVFSEKTKPHCARVKTLKPADLELGELQVRIALRMFARCLDRGIWPGPGGEQSDAEFVEIKPFHRTRIEHRLAVLEQELA